MADVADHRDGGESATLAALLDPVALEARLADARARRAVALAARTAQPAPEGLAAATPRFRARFRAPPRLLAAGIAIAAAGGLLALLLWPSPAAPVMALTAAILASPESIPPAPTLGTDARGPATTPLPRQLAAPDFAAPVFAEAGPPPTLRPQPRPPRRVVAASKARAGGVPFVDAAPVLARAAATARRHAMIGRSADRGLWSYPLAVIQREGARPRASAAPRVVLGADDLVRQLSKASREVVNGALRGDGGEGIVQSIRRATAALEGKPRSEGRQAAPNRSDGPRAAPARSGPPKHAERSRSKGKGGSKSKGADRNEGRSASKGRDRDDHDRGEGRGRDRDDDDD